MKKIYFVLALFVTVGLHAQMLLHGDAPDFQPPNPGSFPSANSVTAPNPFQEYPQKVYNIYYHVIKDINGLPVLGIDETEIMENVRELNVAFNQFNIFFKYRGSDIISDTSFLYIKQYQETALELPSTADLNEYSIVNGYQNNESVNIFIVKKISQQLNDGTFELLPGYEQSFYNPTGDNYIPSIFVMANHFNKVSVHEMGHIFRLYHTNNNGYPTIINCEHVVREENHPLYNAGGTWGQGDGIADTYASPAFYDDADVTPEGLFIGGMLDCTNGMDQPQVWPYNYYGTNTVPIKNYMNVNREEDIDLPDHFTIGQGIWIRQNMELPANVNAFIPFETTIESLYEPFEISGIAGEHIISVNDGPELGIATVCRNYLLSHRFQEGFDYEFPDSQNGDPEAANTYAIPQIKQNTFDFRVKILQVSPEYYGIVKVVCTKGVICNEEPYIGGTIYSTQVLGSMNITVDELNKIEVSDPQLYEKLMSEYYYILKKMTESGAIKENVFYKP